MVFIWCILVSTCIGVGFKLFNRFKVNTFNAIVVNYTVCLILGTILDPDVSIPFSKDIIRTQWFQYDLMLGLLFIVGFNLTATAIQTVGMTMTALIQRMSIILTVAFTVILFKEHFGWLEFTGLSLALLSIIAINQKTNTFSFTPSGSFPWILSAVLIMAAAVEILLFYVDETGIVGDQQMAFTTHGFGSAGIFGYIAFGWMIIKGKFKLSLKDVIAGILLGLPNFFSIFLLMTMLNQGWNGSILYPMVNVSVLLVSTLVAVIAFHEKLNRLNWIGIGMATISILLIAYAHHLHQ